MNEAQIIEQGFLDLQDGERCPDCQTHLLITYATDDNGYSRTIGSCNGCGYTESD